MPASWRRKPAGRDTERYYVTAVTLLLVFPTASWNQPAARLRDVMASRPRGLIIRPRPQLRPHSFWPRPRPWPHAQLASLTSLARLPKTAPTSLTLFVCCQSAIYETDVRVQIRGTESAESVWNSLPKTVVISDSVTVFKSGLKTFLFSRAFCLPASQQHTDAWPQRL